MNQTVDILDKSYSIKNTEQLELFNINGEIPKGIFELKNLRILKLRGSGLYFWIVLVFFMIVVYVVEIMRAWIYMVHCLSQLK